MTSFEERLRARLKSKLDQKAALWEDVTWKQLLEYSDADPDNLPPGKSLTRWRKVQAYFQEVAEQTARDFPDDEPSP